MAARNNIAQHYGYPAQRQMVYWREIEGVPQHVVIERAAKAWPDQPAIHNTTWAAWSGSHDYIEIRDRLVAKLDCDAELDADWAAIEQGGMDDMLAALVFQTVRTSRESGNGIDINDLRKLIASATDLGKYNLDRAAANWRAERESLESEHRAEVEALVMEIAERAAEIQRLKTGGKADLGAVADQMDKLLGGD